MKKNSLFFTLFFTPRGVKASSSYFKSLCFVCPNDLDPQQVARTEHVISSPVSLLEDLLGDLFSHLRILVQQ
jgi:hypothetical protein